MSLDDIDLSNVEEPKDSEFSAVKPCVVELRVKDVKFAPVEGKAYAGYYNVQTEFVSTDGLEPVEAGGVPSAPWVKLYTHNEGSLKMLRRFIEAHGLSWQAFVDAKGSRDEFLKQAIGMSAVAKIELVLKRKDTGEALKSPRNEVRYKLPKAN